jgi:hypothetical protein
MPSFAEIAESLLNLSMSTNSPLTQGNNSEKIGQRQEIVSRAEWMLLQRLRQLSNSMITVIVDNEGKPVGWTVLYKIERPPQSQL